MTALASPARALSQSACEGRQPSELGLPEAEPRVLTIAGLHGLLDDPVDGPAVPVTESADRDDHGVCAMVGRA